MGDDAEVLETARAVLREADPDLQDALDRRKRVLGENHPDTLRTAEALKKAG
ncbi:tetratricopeptide repeat protein [Amycolatopsis sp. lyj-346]|uniref:tetratricopeptide repeat protein n=1 Tax=Amycolatopsis sp. lyj-346 TaxID=2789289 RepID=UPI00397C4742